MFSEKLKEQFAAAAASRLKKLPERNRQYEAWKEQASETERELMTMIVASLPLSDVQDYEPELFGAYASHGAMLWEKGPFAGWIPEDIFAAYVAHPRINTEELADCRAFFWEQLQDRLAGKSFEEAALAVNVWCAEQGTYRSSDARTESPLTFHRSGYGRCGEESVFAVSALRSAGIPARQVFVPLWSHCDDNHAWVEVWCGDGWKFLGACEPEPILNRGWFTDASSRAMMVHARWYLPTEPQEEVSGSEGMVRQLNVTARYADTVRVQVTVQDESGSAVKDAGIHWRVYNESAFGDIANGVTDAEGHASLETGKGTLLVTANTKTQYGEVLVNTTKETTVTLTLAAHKKAGEPADWSKFRLEAPEDSAKNRTILTEAQQAEKKEIAAQTAGKRAEKQVKQSTAWTDRQREVLATLSEKDALDVTAEVLEDAWNVIPDVQPKWIHLVTPEEREIQWRQYVLCPRVENERLVPHRKEILARYEKAQASAGKALTAEAFVRMELENLRSCPEEEYPVLRNSASGLLNGGWYSGDSVKILQVQIFRTLGVHARWNQTDDAVELWDGQDWLIFEADEEKAAIPQMKKAMLHIFAPETWKYGVDWTVSQWKGNEWRTLPVEKDMEERTLLVAPGDYRIETANRLPGGTVLASRTELELREDEVHTVWLEKQEAQTAELLTEYDLPNVTLKSWKAEGETSLFALTKDRPGLFLWLEPGAEPTEHLLNELMEYRNIFADGHIGVYGLLAVSADDAQPTLQRARTAIPNLQLYAADFDLEMEAAARRMYLEPGKLPLVILVDPAKRGRFGEAGYFVGLGKLLQELIPLV